MVLVILCDPLIKSAKVLQNRGRTALFPGKRNGFFTVFPVNIGLMKKRLRAFMREGKEPLKRIGDSSFV
ncbi:MAG: hypothetical protein AAGI90_04660 [Chlamydiota bacterium]